MDGQRKGWSLYCNCQCADCVLLGKTGYIYLEGSGIVLVSTVALEFCSMKSDPYQRNFAHSKSISITRSPFFKIFAGRTSSCSMPSFRIFPTTRLISALYFWGSAISSRPHDITACVQSCQYRTPLSWAARRGNSNVVSCYLRTTKKIA